MAGTQIPRARFRRLVAAALDSLPPQFAERLDNVEILVRMRPTPAELESVDTEAGGTLFGLYQGVPLTRRGHLYGSTLPDRILIYQEPIEAICESEEEVIAQVRTTVLHEIAHHFGIDDERLEELGLD